MGVQSSQTSAQLFSTVEITPIQYWNTIAKQSSMSDGAEHLILLHLCNSIPTLSPDGHTTCTPNIPKSRFVLHGVSKPTLCVTPGYMAGEDEGLCEQRVRALMLLGSTSEVPTTMRPVSQDKATGAVVFCTSEVQVDNSLHQRQLNAESGYLGSRS